MNPFLESLSSLKNLIPIIRTIIVVVIVFIILDSLIIFIKKQLLKRAKSKKQKSNVEIFARVSKYMIVLILVLFAIFSYTGSWTGLGLTVGLLSAALGWALQKPITGIAGWIMVVTKRPFEIGDRVIIGTVKGDVVDINLTHIHLREIGGIVAGEESSGRIIMVPNSTLFEQTIINYTQQDEYMLDQVAVTVTFESNIDKAIKLALESAKAHTKDVIKATKHEPYIRTYFKPSGIFVSVRYYSPVKRIQEFSSIITKEIFDRIRKTRDVKIAVPHVKIITDKKK